jgi:hypothetical protein
MDGSNGSTTFTDSSSNARTVTVGGDAQISTAQSKFGGASGYFDGSGDLLNATVAAIGTGAYTIEGWFYTSLVNPSWKSLAALSDGLMVYFHQGAVVGYGGDIPSSALRSKQGQFGPQAALAANTWHHWAITRTSAGVVNVFANGVAGGLDFGNGAAQTGNTYNSTGTTFRVGVAAGGAGENFDGYLDEIRFTPGVARYTANFTPPTAPFPTPPAAPNPIPALSPVLWYDFADESTVGVLESGEIAQVTDKGSRGWTLTKTTEPASPAGPQYVSGINGLQCVDWGSSEHSNRLRNTDTTFTNVAEMYFVLDAAFGESFITYNGLAGGTDDPVNLTGGGGSTGFYGPGITTPWNRAFLNGSTTNVYYYGVLPTINSASLLRINRSDDAAVELTSGFQIGMDRNNSWRGWFGLIGEVVCFSSVLSPTDRNAVQAWLAAKWGITLV